MAGDEVVALNSIISRLTGENSKSISTLIEEVRDSVKDQSGPTVSAAIINLQKSIKDNFEALAASLRSNTGGIAGTPTDRGERDHGQKRQDATVEYLIKIYEELAILRSVGVGGHGGHGGGTGNSPFDVDVTRRRFETVESILEQKTTSTFDKLQGLILKFTDQSGVFYQQLQMHQKEAAFGLMNLAAKSTDLFYIFEKLGNFIKTNVVEKYSGYMTNRAGGLTATQYMTDDIYRIIRTLSGQREEIGYGLAATQESVKRSMGEGVASPNLMYGKTIDQMSVMYRQAMEGLEKAGVNPRGFGSPEQLMKMIDVIQEQQKNMAPFKDMRSAEAQATLGAQITYLKDIAKYTNMSADELIKLSKANTQEVTDIEAVGSITKAQGDNLIPYLAGLKSMGASGDFIAEWVKKYAASGMDTQKFIANNEEVATLNLLMHGQFIPLVQKWANIATSGGSFAEQQKATIVAAQQAQPYVNLGGTAGIENKIFPGYSKFAGGIQSTAGFNPQPAPVSNAPDKLQGVLTTVEDFFAKVPMFSSSITLFAGAVAGFVAGVVKFSIAGRMLGVGSTLAGGGEAAAATAAGGWGVTRALGTAAKFGGPVLAGVGSAAVTALEGGTTSESVGSGVGSGIGAAGLGFIGSLIAPGIGTAIGMTAGTYLGGILGKTIADFIEPPKAAVQSDDTTTSTPASVIQPPIIQPYQVAPTIQPPENQVGPSGVDISGSTSTSYQDSHLNMLSQLIMGSQQTNSILGQMYGELTKQTGLSVQGAGDSGTAGNYGGRGLSAPGVAPVAKTGRPDGSTSWVGNS